MENLYLTDAVGEAIRQRKENKKRSFRKVLFINIFLILLLILALYRVAQ